MEIKEVIKAVSSADIWQVLAGVKDPEIPVLSVVDMGMVADVQVAADYKVQVTITPTFVGCPAINIIKQSIVDAVKTLGVTAVEVKVDFETTWSTNRMTAEAKVKLEKFGLAPPPFIEGELTAEQLDKVRCPHCGSTDTTLRSGFGSTLCRAIRFCFNCKQGFEQFKPVK